MVPAAKFARVRVIYDLGESHDQPNKGSRAVAAALRAAGVEADAVQLPASLGVGGDVDDLHRLVGDDGLADALRELPVLDSEQDHAASGRRAFVTTLADVEPEPVNWLWASRIPLGKLSLLAGDPGLGKSYIVLDCAARLSTGSPWPDGNLSPGPADTLLLVGEDGVADTIRPRLDRLHGDAQRVHVMTDVEDEKSTRRRFVRLDRDVEAIERVVRDYGVKLVVVDPINAFLGIDVDAIKGVSVRSALTPLAAMAGRTGAAVLLVAHLNKNALTQAIYRVSGSVDFVGAARSVLAVGPDPNDESGRRLLVPVKANLSAPAPGLGFAIHDGVLAWDKQPVDVGAAAILSGGTTASGDGRTRRQQEATEFLARLLAAGPQSATEVYAAARQKEIAERTLDRAKQALGVDSVRVGSPPAWFWRLPGDTRAPRAAYGSLDNLGAVGTLGVLDDVGVASSPNGATKGQECQGRQGCQQCQESHNMEGDAEWF